MLVHLKASEARLRESEEKYRFIFDNGPSPIFVFDTETTMILDVNARAEEEYQFTRGELLTMGFADLGLDRDRGNCEPFTTTFLNGSNFASGDSAQTQRRVAFHGKLPSFSDNLQETDPQL